jgi:transcriptional regulator with XRE-family HTH domain
MDTLHERLRQARKQAGYSSMEQFSQKFRIPFPTYRSHEEGKRGIKEDMVRKYSEHLGVNWVWLLTGEGEMRGAGGTAPELDRGMLSEAMTLANKLVDERGLSIGVEDKSELAGDLYLALHRQREKDELGPLSEDLLDHLMSKVITLSANKSR